MIYGHNVYLKWRVSRKVRDLYWWSSAVQSQQRSNIVWYALSSLVKRFHKVKYLNKFCYTYSLLELNACYLKINRAKFIPHLDSPFACAVKENTHLHNKALSVEVRKLQCTHAHKHSHKISTSLTNFTARNVNPPLFHRVVENYAQRNMTLIIVLTIVDTHIYI